MRKSLSLPRRVKVNYMDKSGFHAAIDLAFLLESIEGSNIGFRPVMEIYTKVRGVYCIVPRRFKITGHEARRDNGFEIKYDDLIPGGSLVSAADGAKIPISVRIYNSYQDFLDQKINLSSQ